MLWRTPLGISPTSPILWISTFTLTCPRMKNRTTPSASSAILAAPSASAAVTSQNGIGCPLREPLCNKFLMHPHRLASWRRFQRRRKYHIDDPCGQETGWPQHPWPIEHEPRHLVVVARHSCIVTAPSATQASGQFLSPPKELS